MNTLADNEDAQAILAMRLWPSRSLVTALARGAVEWWWDPRGRSPLLRSRTGKCYRARFLGKGWLVSQTNV